MFLMRLPRFQEWKYDEIGGLIKAMDLCDLAEGTVIYNIGDHPENIYIILQGAVFLETNFETSSEVRYPVGKHKWETKRTVKTSKFESPNLKLTLLFLLIY